MDQSIAQQFGRALVFLLEKEGWGAQTRLAREQGIDRGYLNAIIQGRKTGSENVRSKIADHFRMPYEKMLALGRRLLEEPGQGKEGGLGHEFVERTSQDAEKIPGKSVAVATAGTGSLSISARIQKAVEVLETESEYQLRLADLIDIFHESLMTKKENTGLHLKVAEMEQRILDPENMLVEKKDGGGK